MLAFVCNLKPPCKLKPKSVGSVLHGHADAQSRMDKVRIVAGSRIQAPGGWTTLAPVASAQDVLLVLSHITGMGLFCRTQDAVSGSMQAPAPRPRTLYKQPRDSVWDKDPLSRNPDGGPRFLLAHKAVYGDTKSKKRWFNLLSGVLRDHGFKPADPFGCVLILHTSEGIIIVALIVDDCLNVHSCQVMYQKLSRLRQHSPRTGRRTHRQVQRP